MDNLKYLRLLNYNTEGLNIRDIVKLKHADRSSNESFFFRMYLKQNIPFFINFDSQTLSNLSRSTVYHSYRKGAVIYEAGHQSVNFFMVLFGEV